jgi:hypothetical protein
METIELERAIDNNRNTVINVMDLLFIIYISIFSLKIFIQIIT